MKDLMKKKELATTVRKTVLDAFLNPNIPTLGYDIMEFANNLMQENDFTFDKDVLEASVIGVYKTKEDLMTDLRLLVPTMKLVDDEIDAITLPFTSAEGITIPLILVPKYETIEGKLSEEEATILTLSTLTHELTHARQVLEQGLDIQDKIYDSTKVERIDKKTYSNNALEVEAFDAQCKFLEDRGYNYLSTRIKMLLMLFKR